MVWPPDRRGQRDDAEHPLDVVAQINAPVLGLYGAKDQGIPVSDVDDMKAA